MKHAAMTLVFMFFCVEVVVAREKLDSGLHYSQMHIRFVQGELDSGTDGDGFEFELNYDFHGAVFILRVIKLEYPGDATTWGTQIHVGGFGGYFSLADDADLYGGVEHGPYDLESTTAKLADADVTILTLGLRRRFNRQAEARFYAGRYDYATNTRNPASDVRDQTVFGIRGIYYMPEFTLFGINAGIEVFDTYQYFGLGLTADF